jgi:hypothetical protein
MKKPKTYRVTEKDFSEIQVRLLPKERYINQHFTKEPSLKDVLFMYFSCVGEFTPKSSTQLANKYLKKWLKAVERKSK